MPLRLLVTCRLQIWRCSAFALVCCCALVLSAPTSFSEGITAVQIDGEVQALIRDIRRRQAANGSWTFAQHRVGYTALNVLALTAAGITEDDPTVRQAVTFLKNNFPGKNTYEVGLYATALQAVDGRKFRAEISRAADWLTSRQHRGTWNYGGTGSGDHSVTQFAMLGIKAALDANIDVSQKVLQTNERHFRGTQEADGGWSYSPGDGSTTAMTAAALSSLHVCGAALERSLELAEGPQFLGRYEPDKQLNAGLSYLANNLQMSPPYTAYAVERVGIFFDRRYLGDVDWYFAGCNSLLSTDSKSLTGHADLPFKLLFLAKGNIPVLVTKIQWGAEVATDWNNRRNDVRHIVRTTGRLFQQPLDWQSARLSTTDAEFARSPILYLSGHRELQLEVDELKALYAFLEDGGTVLIAPDLNSKTFIRSTLAALQHLYPGSRFEKLPRSHAMRGMYYNLRERDVPLRVLRTGCVEKRIFIMESDLSIAFEQAQPPKWSRQLMANLSRFALREKPLIKRLEIATVSDPEAIHAERSAYARAGGIEKGALAIAQIEHDGEFNPDENAITNFLGFLRQSLEMPTTAQTRFIGLTDPDLKFYPVLYTSGHESLPLSRAEKERLRSYLHNGGFLIADSCCTKAEFDSTFRSLMHELFPQARLERISPDAAVFHEPFEVDPQFQVPPGGSTTERRADFLWGIRVGQRYVVIYSPWDLGCSMDDHLEKDMAGIAAPSSFQIMTNILSYSLTY